jgi:hypothetical protein
MMESMMSNMSKQEKQQMMEKMMEQFFSGMTDKEKQQMMMQMMPKMMQEMMGGEMGEQGAGTNPMDMCRNMMSSMNKKSELHTIATPEIQGMFEEWLQQINTEILEFLKGKSSISIEEIAEHLKISKQSAIYLVSRLAQNENIEIKIN